MANCPNCGNEIIGDNKFCARCGYKIEEEPARQEIKEPHAEQEVQPTSEADVQPAPQNYVIPENTQQMNFNKYGNATNKNKWIIPAAICAVIFLVMAATIVSLLARPSAKTPTGAVKMAVNEMIDEYEIYMNSDDYADTLPDDAAEYVDDFKKIDEYFLDSFKYKITDVEIDKDKRTATVKIEYSTADTSKIFTDISFPSDFSDKDAVKKYFSDVKKAYKEKDKKTDTVEIELYQYGKSWKTRMSISSYFNVYFY